jgi:hypothetical protein
VAALVGNTLRTTRPAKVWLADRPSLVISTGLDQQSCNGVEICGLDPGLMVSLRRYLQAGARPESVFQVAVVPAESSIGDDVPDVFGRYCLLEDGIRFIPHFPFERGLSFRASFDPQPLGRDADVLTHEFSLPKAQSTVQTEVQHIYPSCNELPENLLRFYVCFSDSMQQGRAQAEISILGPDGEPAADVLYRAPVELWDRGMRCLTILLDPGRLKRGVGPNRELGPPLKSGEVYSLAVGMGMTDSDGQQLRETVYKRFRVTEAVREPVAVEQWEMLLPEANSRQPLALMFPSALDWAQLLHSIAVLSEDEQSIEGQIVVDQCERRWAFTPAAPWAPGSYQVRIATSLEDVCGNNLVAAFDRPLRPGSDLACEAAGRSIPFHLA